MSPNVVEPLLYILNFIQALFLLKWSKFIAQPFQALKPCPAVIAFLARLFKTISVVQWFYVRFDDDYYWVAFQI